MSRDFSIEAEKLINEYVKYKYSKSGSIEKFAAYKGNILEDDLEQIYNIQKMREDARKTKNIIHRKNKIGKANKRKNDFISVDTIMNISLICILTIIVLIVCQIAT